MSRGLTDPAPEQDNSSTVKIIQGSTLGELWEAIVDLRAQFPAETKVVWVDSYAPPSEGVVHAAIAFASPKP